MTSTRWGALTTVEAIFAHQRRFQTSAVEAATRIIAFRAERGHTDDSHSIPTSEFVDYRNRVLFGHDWLLSYREQRMRVGGFGNG